MGDYGHQEEVDTRECEAMRKMFVGGLNRQTTDEEFNNFFSQFGNMVDSVIIKETTTRESRGFGFVTYDASDSVEKVFKARPHELGGKTLDVKRAMPREYNTATAHSKVTKLFIGGISPDLTPEELQEYIERRHPTSIGTVDKIDFLKERDSNKNKGFGFLECSDPDFADRLTISENSFQIKGKSMSLKKAEPKNSEGGGGRGGPRGGGRGGRGTGRGRGGSRGGFGRGGGGSSGGGGGGYGGDQSGYNNYNQGYGDQTNSYNYNTGGYNSYAQPNQGGYNNYAPNTGGYGQGVAGGYDQQQQQQYNQYGRQNYGMPKRGGGAGGNRYNPY